MGAMKDWKTQIRESVTTLDALQEQLDCDITALDGVIQSFPMRINPYFLNLITHPEDPIGRQAIPDLKEIQDSVCVDDPLGEEELSPVPNLVHKYPDRVLFLVSSECAMYCRFCTRKRMVGTRKMVITDDTIQQGINYLKEHDEVREVLLSGGDPLLLSDNRLDYLLRELRAIRSIEVIRIGTRVPSVLPMRVTSELVQILKKYHPLYINTHFNHPKEITPESSLACTMLADAGIPVGCQTVLLRGVNDNTETIKELMLALLKIRVRPYYLFQADLTKGVNHFRTPTKKGIEIMKNLYGHISGLAVPTFAIDAPGGKGKIPLTPTYVKESSATKIVFETFSGEICSYPESGDSC
jgi:lysine 2,3-aminomutase